MWRLLFGYREVKQSQTYYGAARIHLYLLVIPATEMHVLKALHPVK